MKFRIQNSEFRMIVVAVALLVLAGCPGGGGGFADSDGDGFSDTDERFGDPGTDPFNPNDTPLNPIDSDGDGCSDFDEINFADFCDNDPNTGDGPPAGESNTFSLRIVRHEDQPLSAGQVDSIFQSATELLQSELSTCPDVAASVTFIRRGNVETFDNGGPVVTTEAQLDALFDLPGDFKVVAEMIGVCGAANNDMTTLLGCSFEDGSVVIIAEAPPDVWAHEWGHVKGLPHRDSCASNIMHTTELNTDAINQFERTAFLSAGPRDTTGKAQAARAARGRAADPWWADVTHLAPDDAEPIEQWIGRVLDRDYRAGLPAALATFAAPLTQTPGLTPQASSLRLSRLRSMAAIAPSARTRANAARLLGLAGDVESVPQLTASVTARAGALSRDEFNACVEGMLALGRLAPLDESGAAHEYLVKGADPQSWCDRDVTWEYRGLRSERRNELLAKLSIMALGLSQTETAVARLLDLREMIDAGQLDAEGFADQVDEALVRCQGLAVKSRPGITP